MTTAHPATRPSTRPRASLPRPAHPAPPVGPRRVPHQVSLERRSAAKQAGVAPAPTARLRAWLAHRRLRVEKVLVMFVLLILLALTLLLLGLEWLDSGGSAGSNATTAVSAPPALAAHPREGGP